LAAAAALDVVQYVATTITDAAAADDVPRQFPSAGAAPSVQRERVEAEQLRGLLRGQELVEVGTGLFHENSGEDRFDAPAPLPAFGAAAAPFPARGSSSGECLRLAVPVGRVVRRPRHLRDRAGKEAARPITPCRHRAWS
jgi:hypothetical protein